MTNASLSRAPASTRHVAAARVTAVRIACCVVGIGLAGCQSWTAPSAPTWLKNPLAKTETVNPPQRMAVIWSEDLISTPNSPPTRGFGGRIYLYDAKDKPMKAEGQLVVFAFNDSRMQPGKERIPDRKYVFPADKLAEHFSESQIGPSYSIWLPWDQVPAAQTEISLLPVFTTKDGKIVVGSQNTNLLVARNVDGSASIENRLQVTRSTRPEGNQRAAQRGASRGAPGEVSEVGQVSFDGAEPQPSRMRTLTIPMTQEMAQRISTGATPPTGAATLGPAGMSTSGQTPNASHPANRPFMPNNGIQGGASGGVNGAGAGVLPPQAAIGGPNGAAMNAGASVAMLPGTSGMNSIPANVMGPSFGPGGPKWPAPINTLPDASVTGSLRVAGSGAPWDPFANPQLQYANRSGLPRSQAPASPDVQ